MGNSLRCCIACMLPCGALDVVRVLHADGRVDEYRGPITAGEVMKANPKHVLAQPTCQGLVQKSSIVHPDHLLRKGKIYFLIPAYTLHRRPKNSTHSQNHSHSNNNNNNNKTPKNDSHSQNPNQNRSRGHNHNDENSSSYRSSDDDNGKDVMVNRPKVETSESKPERGTQRVHRRRLSGQVGAWKPALGSISETDSVL
ncbi:GATA zinc finger domain-containing protein 13 [Amborella trichopoda]|uniref:Uncharacterized protein n=1 Tax=Amborella trichopoda TaxID=13333 RepID=W1NE46_AMBTC|nr:GATA zinc finger domain-containing protein 13 [Amborella trichopoda]ERM94057.1 hypothetical protein AMTR_s00010p00060450 [Amborella trichopoda]|eukprot:XP_006826820.1 GATA zinc finger domain-containing protein 13 [Amborella trichopoda]